MTDNKEDKVVEGELDNLDVWVALEAIAFVPRTRNMADLTFDKEELTETIQGLIEAARESERSLVERAAYNNAYEHFREELNRLSHPVVRVLRKDGDILIVEQLEDIKFGGDVIEAIIATQAAEVIK